MNLRAWSAAGAGAGGHIHPSACVSLLGRCLRPACEEDVVQAGTALPSLRRREAPNLVNLLVDGTPPDHGCNERWDLMCAPPRWCGSLMSSRD
jgi:hypothetical protein